MLKIKDETYLKFSVQERLNLMLAAFARDDVEEAQRLHRTCPKYRYLATDYEFTRRLDTLGWVGDKYAELCQYYYDKILLSQASLSVIPLIGEEAASKMPYTLKDMEEARIGHISTLKAIHQALIEFCNDVGIDSNQLIKWMYPQGVPAGINVYLSYAGVDSDCEFTRHIKNKFMVRWINQINLS